MNAQSASKKWWLLNTELGVQHMGAGVLHPLASRLCLSCSSIYSMLKMLLEVGNGSAVLPAH